jgi:serine/threonine protein kinase
MPTDTTPDPLVAALRDAGLLAPDQLDDLSRWAALYRPDPTVLAAEVVRREWLTAYQMRQVVRGRADELTVGPYRFVDLIGQGGMGRVYKARHTRLGREAAVKVIKKEKLTKPQMIDRFRQEIRVVAQLAHPNVVLALDADEANGTHYYAMEYVAGSDLNKLVKEKGPLPVVVACEYIRQAAAGLQHAHDRGLVHRDVKPGNLLVTPKGVVKVLDLGLALLAADPSAIDQQTPDKFLIGTPDYTPPEQIRNPLGVDARADVYGLGATLFYLLTGRPPYGGDTPTDKLVQTLTAPVPDPAAVRPDLPPDLCAVVRWMMAKQPEDRPASVAVAAQALAPFAPATSVAVESGAKFQFNTPISKPPPPAATTRRRWPLIPTIGGAAVVVAGVALTLFGGKRPEPLPAEFVNGVGMKLVTVPGGTVVLGSPADEMGRQPDEPPPAEVTVAGPFCAAVTEVTNAQYLAVMGRSPAVWPGKFRKGVATAVESVTWAEAVEFCRKLNEREPNRRPGWSYRLPSEAEWEYLCRAGTTTRFWSGDALVPGKDAAYNPDDANEARVPSPAGTGGPNPFGLFDTSGGVWEWVAGRTDGQGMVARGGSWREPAGRCRSASRMVLTGDQRRDDLGFRVVFAPNR